MNIPAHMLAAIRKRRAARAARRAEEAQYAEMARQHERINAAARAEQRAIMAGRQETRR